MNSKKTKGNDLWAQVTKTVRPLDKSDKLVPDLPKVRPARRDRLFSADPAPFVRHYHPADNASDSAAAQLPKRQSPPQAIDKKAQRRIARGHIDIDRTLDLHGMTQQAALMRLERAVVEGVAMGQRTLLVITGKGGRRFSQSAADLPVAQRRRSDFELHGGVLKRMVPIWLTTPPLDHYIAGYSPADASHGGAGALYVRLRRQSR